MNIDKTIIILGSKNHADKNNAAALAAAASSGLEGATVRHYYFEDLVFHISNQSRAIGAADGFDLKNAQLVVAFNWYPAGTHSLRDLAYTVALYLQENDVQFWNSEMLQQRSTTKLSAMWLLAQLGVAIPETFFSLNHDQLAQHCHFNQAVVKAVAASRGRDNYLAHSTDEIRQLLAAHSQQAFLVQEFISNDYDVRLVCFGGTVRLAMKRQRTSNATHLNNTSQGGQSTLLPVDDLPENVRAEAAKICAYFRREMAGIDYLVANDGSARYICLEVNAIPQLTSGSYVDQKLQAFKKAIEF